MQARESNTMKRIIDGKTYNTDTATTVARWDYQDENGYDTAVTLYQTRGAAFFAVHLWTVDEVVKVYFESFTREGVARLVEHIDNLTILDSSILQDPPEATDDSETTATLYIRVPASLKDRLEALAKADGVSLNTWTMRCVERCAGDQAPAKTTPGKTIQTAPRGAAIDLVVTNDTIQVPENAVKMTSEEILQILTPYTEVPVSPRPNPASAALPRLSPR
jgi:hypothetical protein